MDSEFSILASSSLQSLEPEVSEAISVRLLWQHRLQMCIVGSSCGRSCAFRYS